MHQSVDTDSHFVDELRREALRWPMEQARLVRLLQTRRAPRRVLRAMAFDMHQGAKRFVGDLATLLDRAPSDSAKLHLLENLLDEEGIAVVPGTGLVIRSKAVHLVWARRFAVACGVPASELDAGGDRIHPLNSQDWFDVALRDANWLGACSYLFAKEYNLSRTLELIVDGLIGMGLTAADLQFVVAHIAADKIHGETGLSLIAREAITPEKRLAALTGMARGASDWWKIFNLRSAPAPSVAV